MPELLNHIGSVGEYAAGFVAACVLMFGLVKLGMKSLPILLGKNGKKSYEELILTELQKHTPLLESHKERLDDLKQNGQCMIEKLSDLSSATAISLDRQQQTLNSMQNLTNIVIQQKKE